MSSRWIDVKALCRQCICRMSNGQSLRRPSRDVIRCSLRCPIFSMILDHLWLEPAKRSLMTSSMRQQSDFHRSYPISSATGSQRGCHQIGTRKSRSSCDGCKLRRYEPISRHPVRSFHLCECTRIRRRIIEHVSTESFASGLVTSKYRII